MEWTRNKASEYYNWAMPWMEDKYLQWYGENKASYATKETMNTKIAPEGTGVDKLQSGLAEGVGGQLAPGGLLGSVGNTASKEGVNRWERGEHEEAGKSWTQTLSGGFMGGGEQKDQKDEGKKQKGGDSNSKK